MTPIPIPFYSNTDDDLHCLQACLKMIFKFFEPNNDYSFENLDKLSYQMPGKYTWTIGSVINLNKMGYEVILLDSFDYSRFSNEGYDYMKEVWGEEVAKDQKVMSDIDQEMRLSKELIESKINIVKEYNLNSLKKFIDQDFFIIANVNYWTFENKDNSLGHSVLVFGIDNDHVNFHDPGLPPKPDQRVSRELFNRAWSFTHEAMAVRLPKPD